jgi:uncharacterized repeat protein (TIGR02543 family)
MMKKNLAFIVVILMLFFVLAACDDGEESILDGVEIVAVDQYNVPVGTYQIPYTVDDLSNLLKTYSAVLSFTVLNQDNEAVIVTGETIVIEANMVYTVHIKLMVGEELIEKTITVTAITQSQVFFTVVFHLNGGIGTFLDQSVLSGSVANLPENEPTKNGYTFTGWYSDQGLLHFFDFGDAVISDLDLYAGFEPILVITSVVHFNLMGGSGTINDQIIALGGYAVLPSVIPTKTGFTFGGWYDDEEGLSAFLFDLTMIYSQTTIYAKWEEIIATVNYTVNYDFNGAVQLETVTEDVLENEFAVGLTQNPMYPNYTLYGWALDAEGLDMWNFQTDEVTADITLFAIWHFNYLEIDAFAYFEEPIILDQSIINNYEIEQILEHHVILLGNDLDDEFPNLGAFKAVGMLYSLTVQNPKYYSEHTIRVEQTGVYDNIESWTAVNYYVNTLPLMEDSVYHVVYFARFESSIVYSDTTSFETINVVPTGTVVGAEYLLSGGFYQVDNGSLSTRPHMMFEIENGFDATHENMPYNSYQYIYKSGYNSLITRNISSGEKYLHVYHVEYAKPFVNTNYIFKTSDALGMKLSYEFTFAQLEFITYSISEVGVLLSHDYPFLQIGYPGVTKVTGIVNQAQTEFQMSQDYLYPGGHETVYARGYVVIDGIVHYSTKIDQFSYYANEQTYISAGSLSVNHIETTTYSGHDVYKGAGVEFNVYQKLESSYDVKAYTNTTHFGTAGSYFIYQQGYNTVEEIFVTDQYPVITGVVDDGTYPGGVVIENDMFDPYWYYAKDGGDFVYLPTSIKLVEPGFYDVYVQGPNGMQSISFTITA